MNRSSCRTSIALWRLTSCMGCQLRVLDLGETLDELDTAGEIVRFPFAGRMGERSRYDLSLVEGSVSTPQDLAALYDIRERSEVVVALGTCATAGGPQSMRNHKDLRQARREAAAPEVVSLLLEATFLAAHVTVDVFLPGCPVDKTAAADVLGALVRGVAPRQERGSVCLECKRAGRECVMVSRQTACLGPVTQNGCGALCPSVGRGCFGCFGPQETAEPAYLEEWFEGVMGLGPAERTALWRNVAAGASPFSRFGG